MVREVRASDYPAILAIINYYIEHSYATFTEKPMEMDALTEKIQNIQQEFQWLVYEEEGIILGYAYSNRWNNRCAYRLTAEVSVYLREDATGRGIGGRLYEALISRLRVSRMHAVIGGISLPNKASEHLHEKLGFKKVAHFKEVGYKFSQWIDVGYWELLLDNPS